MISFKIYVQLPSVLPDITLIWKTKVDFISYYLRTYIRRYIEGTFEGRLPSYKKLPSLDYEPSFVDYEPSFVDYIPS